jgi:hypothetical protein
MKRIHLLVASLVIAAGWARAAEPGFWQQLTPEERRTAGLDRLSPDQQAALDGLAARFAREGARQVREQVKQEVRAEALVQVREEVKQEVREEVKREMKSEEKTRAVAQAGLPAEEPKDLAVRSRALGKFHGWSGETVFRLENGQIWVQTDNTDSFWLPAMENPEVEIRRSAIGGWKLYLGGKSSWVRVRRVK